MSDRSEYVTMRDCRMIREEERSERATASRWALTTLVVILLALLGSIGGVGRWTWAEAEEQTEIKKDVETLKVHVEKSETMLTEIRDAVVAVNTPKP